MKLQEVLNLASCQDEYLILHRKAKIIIKNPDDIPEFLENKEVTGIYGYDAEGYDGLQITLAD